MYILLSTFALLVPVIVAIAWRQLKRRQCGQGRDVTAASPAAIAEYKGDALVGDTGTRLIEFPPRPRALEHDPLTKTLSRNHLNDLLSGQLAFCRRNRQPLGLMLVSVKHRLNQSAIAERGLQDRVLMLASSVLRPTLRSGDLIFRFGGNTFAIVMPGADQQMAGTGTERVRAALLNASGGAIHALTAAVVTQCDGRSAASLVRLAEECLADEARGRRDPILAKARGHLETVCFSVPAAPGQV